MSDHPRLIGWEAEPALDWRALGAAFEAGHTRPKAEIRDTFLYLGENTVLNRMAAIDGMGLLVKTATLWPANAAAGLPVVGGGVQLFSGDTGRLEAVIDFALLTKWKTAGDSAFAASRLARPDSRRILIVGAGTVGRSLRAAYATWFPDAEFLVWNRSAAAAERFAAELDATAVRDLEAAVGAADIITTATMSATPVIHGDWLRPGQHLDLIGAYRPEMRETDDAALARARIFVDSRETTLDHIGELKIPLESGAIAREDVVADFYDIAGGTFARTDREEITLFKNGGGAHLDLMAARYVLAAVP